MVTIEVVMDVVVNMKTTGATLEPLFTTTSVNQSQKPETRDFLDNLGPCCFS